MRPHFQHQTQQAIEKIKNKENEDIFLNYCDVLHKIMFCQKVDMMMCFCQLSPVRQSININSVVQI